MNTIKYATMPGSHFSAVADSAKLLATDKEAVVEFDFNGILCRVSSETDTDLLYRDYSNAFLLELPTIGPVCAPVLDAGTQQEIEKRTRKREAEREEARKTQEAMDWLQRSTIQAAIEGVELELIDAQGFAEWKAKNTDGYGGAIFEFAETWAKLMQSGMAKGKALVDIAEPTSFQMGYLGISGFQYGAAVQVLSKHWKHGDALSHWHKSK